MQMTSYWEKPIVTDPVKKSQNLTESITTHKDPSIEHCPEPQEFTSDT
jgi:hypothetical protein